MGTRPPQQGNEPLRQRFAPTVSIWRYTRKHMSATAINTYDDFKEHIRTAVEGQGMTRGELANRMDAEGILRAHTVRCLLGTPGTRNGRRKPAFDSALAIAHAAGFELILRKRKVRS